MSSQITPPRAILWDIDDVLIDTRYLFFESRKAPLAILGLKPDQFETALSIWNRLYWYFDQSNTEAILEALLSEMRMSSPQTHADINSAAMEYETACMRAEYIRSVEGIFQIVQSLRKQGIPQAIVSNGDPDYQLHKLSITGYSSLFSDSDIIITPSSSELAKPRPYGILRACEILDVTSSDAAYVGDRQSDVIAANLAGSVSILFESLPSAPEVRKAPSEGSLRIEQPDYVVSDAQALSKLVGAF